jgi:DNA-binding NarL/FixJ family response regulator
MPPLRIFLVDDHPVVREGLKALINSHSELEVVGEAVDGESAVAAVAALDPDALLKEGRPSRKIIALTLHEERSYLRLVLDAGASGYVLKRAAAADLIRAIKAVAAGGVYIDPSLMAAEVRSDSSLMSPQPAVGSDRRSPELLSQRESEVLKLIARGYSNKEIAAKLDLSVKTVETYKMRSTQKLGLRSRVEIVRYASEQGWNQPE